jgi:hypothetical protein
MIIIFGTTNRGKRERPLLDTYCYQCRRETTWDWYRLNEWITIFFVPILPTTSGHLLVCTGCHDQLKLERDEAHGVQQLKQLPAREAQELHDRLVQRLKTRQFADKTDTQREFLESQRRENAERK